MGGECEWHSFTVDSNTFKCGQGKKKKFKWWNISENCKIFMCLKLKFWIKIHEFAKKFHQRRKKERKKNHSMGRDYFSLVVESLCMFILQVASHMGFRYLYMCKRELLIFCLTNHMDAHVGECLAIHHLGLVPDWGGRKKKKKMNFKDTTTSQSLLGLLCD